MDFTYKSVSNSQDIKISGYASIFGYVDYHKDIVAKGAFQKSLKAREGDIKFLWQHDKSAPIGKINFIKEDERGLFVEACITSGTEKGREAIDLLQKNILDGLSIGFNVVKSQMDKNGNRVITDLDLWEISLVTFPANIKSKITLKKEGGKIDYSDKHNLSLTNKEKNMTKFIDIYETKSIETKDNSLMNFVRGMADPEEFKNAYSEDSADRGTYAVVAEHYKDIITRISEISPMRLLASVDTISSNSLELLVQNGKFESGWVEERAARDGFNTPRLVSKKINVHEIYAQPKATQRLIDDSFVNIEEWISSQLVQSFAALENTAFINGDGANKPKGILSYDAEIARVESEEDDTITLNDILKLINELDECYQRNASFLMNRRTLSEIQKIKDENGRFIWQSSMSERLPSTLFGIPVYCSSDMPAIAAGRAVVALADFKQAYKIVDRHGITIMKDPYTEKPFTKFYSTKRVGGDVINFDAIKILRI